MPIASGFTRDPKPNYYIRKTANDDLQDEAIYYRRDVPVPVEKPVQVKTNRPIVKETVFLPDRSGTVPPIASNRDIYSISPEPEAYVYTTTNTAANKGSFNLVRALGLNADCPCWSWICIILGFVVLLTLIAVCLYLVLRREDRI